MYKIVDKLYKYEKENKLLDYELNNIKLWQYLRTPIMIDIIIKKGFMRDEDKTKKYIIFHKIIDIFKSMYFFIFNNPIFSFKVFKKTNEIYFVSARKYKVNSKYEDIYLYDFYKKSKHKLMIDNSNEFSILGKKSNWVVLPKILLQKTVFRTKLKLKDVNYIEQLESELKNIVGYKVELLFLFKKYLAVYKSLFFLYSILFKAYKPKNIYITSSYGQAPLIMAAKKYKIEVLEMQHGMFGFFHMGYYFPYNKKIEYFPSVFYVYGEYFKNLDYLPLDKKNIKIHDYSLYSAKKDEYAMLKKENSVLIVSDGYDTGKKYIDFLIKNIEVLEKYDCIYYKLHPQEGAGEFYFDIPEMQELLKMKKFKLIDSSEHIYKYLAICKDVLSCRSTVVYEALEFRCNVAVVKLPGYEDMLDIEKYITFLDLDEKLYFEKKGKPESGYFIYALREENK